MTTVQSDTCERFFPTVEAAVRIAGSSNQGSCPLRRRDHRGIARSDCFDFNDTKLDDAIGGLY
jgi:hypothetical protein